MGVTSALLGDVPTIVAAGAMGDDACEAFQAELDRLFSARYNVIFLDLTDVSSADERFLRVLRGGVEALGGRGWLGPIGLSSQVHSLLEADGILGSPQIRVFADRQAARIATGERAST